MRYIGIFLLAVFFFFSSCTTSDDATDGGDLGLDPDLETVEAKASIQKNNEFALDFFREVVANEEEENYMVSPLSLALALGMTYNGAAGTTAEAFGTVLGQDDVEVANGFNQKLIKSLTASGTGADVGLANAIWIKNDFPVEEEFVSVNRMYYDAEVDNLNFGDSKAVEVVNTWASDNTNNKIEKFVKSFSANTVLFLANALYFKATWKYEFNPDDTRETTFNAVSGEVQVPMMYMNATVPFYANDNFSSVILPYKNDRYQMLVLLPYVGYSTADIVTQLTMDNLNNWLDSYKERELGIYLPKFKMEYENNLNDELVNMGLGVAFSGETNFKKINARASLQISKVFQKTFIEVNEEGTEAAAVTGVQIELTSAAPGFLANRPFLYMIRDSYTGSICFMGKMGNPE